MAWCEYGTPEELPNIQHRKEYQAELDILPDYRLTCFFVDGSTVARYGRVALRGALDLIAQAGGGVVESYPQDTDGKKISRLLYNATRSLFEQAGFTYIRTKGINHCVMRKRSAYLGLSLTPHRANAVGWRQPHRLPGWGLRGRPSQANRGASSARCVKIRTDNSAGAGSSAEPPPPQRPVRRWIRARPADVIDVFVYVVVLNLAIEYLPRSSPKDSCSRC